MFIALTGCYVMDPYWNDLLYLYSLINTLDVRNFLSRIEVKLDLQNY